MRTPALEVTPARRFARARGRAAPPCLRMGRRHRGRVTLLAGLRAVRFISAGTSLRASWIVRTPTPRPGFAAPLSARSSRGAAVFRRRALHAAPTTSRASLRVESNCLVKGLARVEATRSSAPPRNVESRLVPSWSLAGARAARLDAGQQPAYFPDENRSNRAWWAFICTLSHWGPAKARLTTLDCWVEFRDYKL
jgi:hypothetical protein